MDLLHSVFFSSSFFCFVILPFSPILYLLWVLQSSVKMRIRADKGVVTGKGIQKEASKLRFSCSHKRKRTGLDFLIIVFPFFRLQNI